MPTSYVPFRNAHLLSAATSWAEVLGASAIFVGAVWEDSSGYPDCRPDFYRAFEQAIRLGTRPETEIAIQTPVIAMTKAEIVRTGQALRGAVREDLVLLPGQRRGLRRLRVLPPPAARVRRGRRPRSAAVRSSPRP